MSKVLLHTAIDVARVEKEEGREVNNHGRVVIVGQRNESTRVRLRSLLNKRKPPNSLQITF